ncbi:MAG: hypothetical protein DWQ10_17215 [Calditrichaeota bacterium]|nr:MAG: hypothetical protein DWQ10_17215 [Calditrichota bacterium]
MAEDRFQDLRMRRRSRTFEDNSDEDVFRQIASEHGLQSDLDITGPQHRTLAQVNQSDLAFLRDRARAIDAETWIEESTLHAVARARRETDTVTLSYGQSLHEFSVCADLAQQQTTFTASGWDVDAKETLQHDASDSILGSELNGDLSGSAILQQAVGTRTQTIVHQTPATAEETRFYAEAHFREHARQFVTGTAKCEGNPNIRVGTKLTLNGLGDLFNGNYYVNEAIHTYDLRQGYATMFRVERCGIGQSS